MEQWHYGFKFQFLNLQQRYFGDKIDKGDSNFTPFGAWHGMAWHGGWHALACVCVLYEWNCPPLRLEEVPLISFNQLAGPSDELNSGDDLLGRGCFHLN
ncbi:hypothetical protein Csa_007929 [Cucumis sativus]|uniref:Uncharacterized protein n=1 Tax=Cucumis sativus TaxID=3659 RepID=A0A0A0KSE9_CUCSA|nr:hypothetical protein Csa_007929 [Cucumis sativus]